jgi:ankyrin repeat protein
LICGHTSTLKDQSLTVLHGACISEPGNEEIVRLLLRYGVDVNVKSDAGRAALHFVASKGHKRIVPLLVKSGAIVDVTARNGFAALQKRQHGSCP